MRKRPERVRTGLLLITLLFAAVAEAQQRSAAPPPPPAPPPKPSNITEIDLTAPLMGSGTAFGSGFTGPTVGLSITPGGITNPFLQNSSLTVTAGTGLAGGGLVSLGGSTTLSNTGVLSFKGRTGAVVPANADYSFSQISGTASESQLPSTTAFTDKSNTFTLDQSVTGSLNVSNRINLPWTSSSSVGVISLGVDSSNNPLSFIHNYPGNVTGHVVGNTFVGDQAGNFFMDSSVYGNTGIGYSALGSVSGANATSNTGVGYLALGRTDLGFQNTALGFQSLFSNTSGGGNIGIGPYVLPLNETGNDNIAIGFFAGDTGTSGVSNGNDNIYIGEIRGVGGESNTIRIGNSDSSNNYVYQNKTFIAGISGVTTGLTGAVAVLVDAHGQLGTASSSRRFKYDINNMDEATSKLLQLRPVTFRYKQAQSEGSHPLQYGLIAEEVADVYPELVQYDPKTGQPNAVLYQVLPAMLLNEVQKEHKQIEQQQEQIQSLQEQLAQLASQTRQLQMQMATFKAQEDKGSQIAAVAAQR